MERSLRSLRAEPPRPGSVSLFSAIPASPCILEMLEGHMLPPLAPRNTSGATWAAREEKRMAWGCPACGSTARTWLANWVTRSGASPASGCSRTWPEAVQLGMKRRGAASTAPWRAATHALGSAGRLR